METFDVWIPFLEWRKFLYFASCHKKLGGGLLVFFFIYWTVLVNKESFMLLQPIFESKQIFYCILCILWKLFLVLSVFCFCYFFLSRYLHINLSLLFVLVFFFIILRAYLFVFLSSLFCIFFFISRLCAHLSLLFLLFFSLKMSPYIP